MDNVCSKGRDCLMLFCANPHAQYLSHREKILEAVTLSEKIKALESIIGFYLHEVSFKNQTIQ